MSYFFHYSDRFNTGSIILFAQLQTWIKWSIQNGFLNPIRRFKEKLNCNLMVKKIYYLFWIFPPFFSIIKSHLCTKKLIELKSPTLVQRAYRTKYNGSTCPARKTILELARKFEKIGTLLDLPPKPKNQRASRVDALNHVRRRSIIVGQKSKCGCQHFVLSLPEDPSQ